MAALLADIGSLIAPANAGGAAASLVLASVTGQAVGYGVTHVTHGVMAALLLLVFAGAGIAHMPALLHALNIQIEVNPWLAGLIFCFIVFGFVLVAEPAKRGPQAFRNIQVSAKLANLNKVDNNGIVFHITARKPVDFTITQVRLHVEGPVWNVVGELAPAALIWTVRNTMLPLSLCPKNLQPNTIKCGSEAVTTSLHLGVGGDSKDGTSVPDGTPGCSHTTILNSLVKLVDVADPVIMLRLDAGCCDLMTMKFKASQLLSALQVDQPNGGVVHRESATAVSNDARAVDEQLELSADAHS